MWNRGRQTGQKKDQTDTAAPSFSACVLRANMIDKKSSMKSQAFIPKQLMFS